MKPPVRDASHRDRIWHGISQGIIDVLGVRSRPAYAGGEGEALSGVALRHDRRPTLLPVMLDHVNAGRLSLERLVD